MFERIIWATDGSPGADAALAEVKRLAGGSGQIVAVHCTQLLTGRAMGHAADPEDPELVDKIRAQVADLQAEGYSATLLTYRSFGSPADTIAAVAAERDADVIVCGTRGLTALAGALMGSVSQRLIHSAHVPVLVVPDPSPTPEPSARVAINA
jgi:nucleotide-binding universal stress UspA family protein